jgi:hypothetical protein
MKDVRLLWVNKSRKDTEKKKEEKNKFTEPKAK